MKIKAYAVGGTYTPFIGPTTTSTTKAGTTKNASSKTSTTASNNYLKTIMDMANDSLIPSDADKFFKKWQGLMDQMAILGTDSIPSAAIADVKKLAMEGKTNYNNYQAAVTELNKKQADDDISMYGNQLWVEDNNEKKIVTITPTELYESKQEDPQRYTPITNRELLDYRYSPAYGFGYEQHMIDSVRDCTTLKSIIDDYVKQTKELANQEIKGQTASEGTMNDLIVGAKLVMTAGGQVDSATKLTSNQARNFATALYMNSNVKDQNYIRGFLAAHGADPDNKKNIQDLILSRILYNVDNKFGYTPQTTTNSGSGSGSGSKSSSSKGDLSTNSTEMSRAEHYATWPSDASAIENGVKISDLKRKPKDSSTFVTEGWTWGQFQDVNGNPIDKESSLKYVLSNAVESSSWDTSKMYVGNQHITTKQADQMLTNLTEANSKIVSMPALFDENGNVIGINWQLLKSVDEVKSLISKNMTDLEINHILEERNLDDYVTLVKNDSGRLWLKIKDDKLRKFATFGVIGTEKTLDPKLTKDFRVDSTISLEDFEQWINAHSNKQNQVKIDKKWFDGQVYGANIFILYDPTLSSFIYQNGEIIPKEQRMTLGENHELGKAREEQSRNRDNDGFQME